MNIGIVGNGVVGSATAHAFQEHHEVLAYDSNPLRSRAKLQDVLAADIVFVCLPTPQKAGSLECDTDCLDTFFELVAGRAINFVLRSTVPVGYTRMAWDRYGLPNLVHSPEFLTARTAYEDAARPKQLLIGYPNEKREQLKPRPWFPDAVYFLYKEQWPHMKVHEMSSDESEFVKLAQNAFSAVKVAFFNELRAYADKRGMRWGECLDALLAGGWINPMHTQVPGPDGKRGFGGACLPKDTANLITCILKNDVSAIMCSSALIRNQWDREAKP